MFRFCYNRGTRISLKNVRLKKGKKAAAKATAIKDKNDEGYNVSAEVFIRYSDVGIL